MGPVLRRFFTIASAMSLILSVAAAALWVRSYFAPDILFLSSGPGRPLLGVAEVRGTFTLLLYERYH